MRGEPALELSLPLRILFKEKKNKGGWGVRKRRVTESERGKRKTLSADGYTEGR